MARRSAGRGVNRTGRSKGDSQYLPIPYAMARSPAFRSLSGPALKIWVEIRTRYNGNNNGKLSLSLGEAADRLHMSKSTAQRGFAELSRKGFLKLKTKGHWYGRKASEYILTDVPLGEALATRDWQKWQPPQKKQNAVSSRHATQLTAPQGDQTLEGPFHGETRRIVASMSDGTV